MIPIWRSIFNTLSTLSVHTEHQQIPLFITQIKLLYSCACCERAYLIEAYVKEDANNGA